MPDFPKSTQFGKKIPKQKFYDHADIPAAIRRMSVDEVEAIVGSNKFSAQTLNIAASEKVGEIQLFQAILRQKRLSLDVIEAMASAIPYRLVFLLEFSGEFQLRIRHASQSGKRLWFQTAWLPGDSLTLALQGLNLDAVYENFVRQIAGPDLPDTGNLEADIEQGKARTALQKRIASLGRKVVTEKQF